MKVLVLIVLTIAVAFAIPVELDSGDEQSQLTLVDLDNDQLASDDSAPEVARSKRFILKKIALLKAGALGVGALGLAGAAFSGRSAFGGGVSNQIPQSYGPAYGYGNAGPSLTTAYPTPTYVTSQTYVPQPTYSTLPQPAAYGVAPQASFTSPINSALAWKAGLANNLVNGISSGFNGISNGISSGFSGVSSGISSGFNGVGGGFVSAVQQPVVGYSYGAPPPPPPPAPQPIAGGPLPNKPVYVVCDNNN